MTGGVRGCGWAPRHGTGARGHSWARGHRDAPRALTTLAGLAGEGGGACTSSRGGCGLTWHRTPWGRGWPRSAVCAPQSPGAPRERGTSSPPLPVPVRPQEAPQQELPRLPRPLQLFEARRWCPECAPACLAAGPRCGDCVRQVGLGWLCASGPRIQGENQTLPM